MTIKATADTPPPDHYRTYCAECERDLGPAPVDCWWDIVIVCELCDAKLREQAGLTTKESE